MIKLNTLEETPEKDIKKPKPIRIINLMNIISEYAIKNNGTFSEHDIIDIKYKLGHISHWSIVKTILRSKYNISNI